MVQKSNYELMAMQLQSALLSFVCSKPAQMQFAGLLSASLWMKDRLWFSLVQEGELRAKHSGSGKHQPQHRD